MNRTPLAILLAVLLAGPAAAQTRERSPGPDQDLEEAIATARMGGQYHGLARILRVEEDLARYGRIHDYGYWRGDRYKGYTGLPPGYWVYVHPHWFIWRERTRRPWSPEQATGAPDTPFDRPARVPSAWAPGKPGPGGSWLQLSYAAPVRAVAVLVYHTRPGALTRVCSVDAAGNTRVLWSGRDPGVARPGLAVSVIPLRPGPAVNRIRVCLAGARTPGRTGVDAVGLVDWSGRTHWATGATASSYRHAPSPALAAQAPPPRTRIASAVDRALEWLARHQTRHEGYWDADAFFKAAGTPPEGLGYPLYDPGVTGLALLAYLGAGCTQQGGKFKETVGNALKYLKRIQDPEGCFGTQTGHFMYSHAIATLAMAEAYGMTRSPLLRRPVEKGVAFLLAAQNDDPGGRGKLAWRYTVKPGDNDSSVTAWAVMALKSAKTAGIRADFETALEGARRWIERMTDPDTGRVGYVQRGVSPVRAPGRETKWPRQRSEAITAAAMLTRILTGEDPARSRPIQLGTKLLRERLPRWDEATGSIDPYYWYYGTLTAFQVGGDLWKQWRNAVKTAVLEHQRTSGPHRGSWDAVGPWGPDGGRVYTTAILNLCLEVFHRYAGAAGGR